MHLSPCCCISSCLLRGAVLSIHPLSYPEEGFQQAGLSIGLTPDSYNLGNGEALANSHRGGLQAAEKKMNVWGPLC